MIESEFAKFQQLPWGTWRAELRRRDDLDDTQKQELAELLEAHESMPEAFMDGEWIRERRSRVTGGGEWENEIAGNDFQAGDTVGSYRLESKLGEGGFGIVWRASQAEPVVREVALKILKLGMDSVAILKRFKAEQQMLAMMEHPNIATLIEAGMTGGGRPFFAMELVKGSPVTKYCDDRRMGIEARLKIFVDVCLAVNHAHQKGAIHRDLKPSNILVLDDAAGPIAKVIDFGISQATKESEHQFTQLVSARGEAIGTPAYMAPEQFSASDPIDTRADIYALGAILYELLIGSPPGGAHHPINSSGSSDALSGVNCDLARPSTVLRGLDVGDRNELAQRRGVAEAELLSPVSDDLEWIAMKALEREPELRYATVVGLVNDIRKSQVNEPITARPPSRRYILQKYVRRNRGAVLAGCSVVAALFVAAFFGMYQARSSQRVAALAERARGVEKEMRVRSEIAVRLAEIAEKKAVEQHEVAGRHTYAANMLLAFQSHSMHNLRETSRLLRQYYPVGNAPDLRGWEWRYLWGQTRGRSGLEIGKYSERVLSALFCANGEGIITLEDHGRTVLKNLGGDYSEVVMSDSDQSARLESSSGFLTAAVGGERIAALYFSEIMGDYGIKIWGDPKASPIRSINVGSHRPTGLALSPDGNLLAYFSPADGHAVIIELVSGAILHRELLGEGNYGHFDQEGACCFSKNGELLAIGGRGGQIVIVKVSNWERLPKQPRVTGRVTTLAFSPDGRHLAAGSLFQDPRVSVFDLIEEGGDIRLTGHSGFIAKVAFSPDGGLLASASGDQNIKLWRTSDWSEVANLSGHQDEVWCVGFSPGGRRLISASKDRSVKLWHVDDWLKKGEAVFYVEPPFHQFALNPGGDGGLALQDGTAMFYGSVGDVPEFGAGDISQAFWISADRLVCRAISRPEITIRNLAGRVEQRLGLPEDVVDLRFEYIGASGILVVAMKFAESDQVRFDRYDVNSLDMLSTSSLKVPEAVWRNLGAGQSSCAFSRDGGQVAMNWDWYTVKFFDLLTGETTAVLESRDRAGIQGMCLSPDGKTLAYAVRKRSVIEVHDLATMRSRVRLEGHNLVIMGLCFSPDGERLVSTAIGSEPILLWDTTEWKQVASFEPTPGFVSPRASFLPSGDGVVVREEALGSGGYQFKLLGAPPMGMITEDEEKNDK